MKETSKKTASLVEDPEEPEEHEEVYGGPVYNMTGNTININVYEGGKVIFQSGKAPVSPPPGGGG